MHGTSKNTWEYLRLVLKNRTIRLLLPVILVYVFLMLACVYFRREYADDPARMMENITGWCHMMLPMFACWWGLVLHNEWVSGEGNELLYLYLSPGVILKAQLVAEAAYLVGIAACFVGIQAVFDLPMELPLFFLLRLCTEALFMGGIACFLTALVRNTGVPLLLTIVYCVCLDQTFSRYLYPELAASLQTQQLSAENVQWVLATLGIAAAFHVGEIFVYRYIKKYE